MIEGYTHIRAEGAGEGGMGDEEDILYCSKLKVLFGEANEYLVFNLNEAKCVVHVLLHVQRIE